MIIEIKRHSKRANIVDGCLYIDGEFICDTSENANESLPEGLYGIVIHKCRQHARKMPVICLDDGTIKCTECMKLEHVSYNTPMPQYCPQLTMGNGIFSRRDGVIILGVRLVPGCMIHTREAFTEVYERLRKSLERGHKIPVTIKNEFPYA